MNKVRIWNVRGINIPAKHGPISDMFIKNHFSILVFLETKVKKDYANSIMEKCSLRMDRIDNSEHATNGRIWFLCKTYDVSVTLLHKSDQLIHSEV